MKFSCFTTTEKLLRIFASLTAVSLRLFYGDSDITAINHTLLYSNSDRHNYDDDNCNYQQHKPNHGRPVNKSNKLLLHVCSWAKHWLHISRLHLYFSI